MSPRPYRLGQRQAAADETRSRIIAAAHELIAQSDGLSGLTIEAIARQANVARMTVYYQFGSKAGLLEALFDSLAVRGGMEQLAAAFGRAEPLEALTAYVATFTRFWASDRLVLRRLHGLATLDAELEQLMQARNERRRAGLQVIVSRLTEPRGRLTPESINDLVDVLWTLTSFETYDALAGSTRTVEQVASFMQQLVGASVERYDPRDR